MAEDAGEKQQQIPFGNDNKKSNGNDKKSNDNSNDKGQGSGGADG